MKFELCILASLFVLCSADYYATITLYTDGGCTTPQVYEYALLGVCYQNATTIYDSSNNSLVHISYTTEDCSGEPNPYQPEDSVAVDSCELQESGSIYITVAKQFPKVKPTLYTTDMWYGKESNECLTGLQVTTIQWAGACQNTTQGGMLTSFYFSCSDGKPVEYICNDNDDCSSCAPFKITEKPCALLQPGAMPIFASNFCS
eukprot:TRINITY_DN7308_c0_g1_i1.p1 TRINITY_DN7308_c0_g1~~TRINITY_DN7308_c0_g1_i1.p1  ORF type:complete len:216 (-),score=40.95 TRINITY_DN7308_c0_g1_i1:29-637(-)